jgi:acyl carrier protein
MSRIEALTKPIDLLAEALGCPASSLSSESAMYRDYGWDSFGHLRVILALEQAYGIEVSESNFQKYTTLHAIEKLYDRLRRGE